MIPIATYEDFLESFNEEELAELSYLHLPGTNEINRSKIEYQLGRAAKDWLSWFGFTDYVTEGVPTECLGGAVSCEIAIARRRMDFNNPRESVKEDYDSCYQIAREWKSDRLKMISSGDPSPSESVIMSIFSS